MLSSFALSRVAMASKLLVALPFFQLELNYSTSRGYNKFTVIILLNRYRSRSLPVIDHSSFAISHGYNKS